MRYTVSRYLRPGQLFRTDQRLLFLHKLSAGKPVAVSECGNFPRIQNIADEKATWSYIGQWGGNFLLNEDGSVNEEYNTSDSLIEMYNNNLTVTKDKLPDFQNIADKLKADDETAKKENKDPHPIRTKARRDPRIKMKALHQTAGKN